MEDSNKNDNPDETDEFGNKRYRLGTAKPDGDGGEGSASVVEGPGDPAADGDAMRQLDELYLSEMARDLEMRGGEHAPEGLDEAQESFFEGAAEKAAEAAPKRLYRLGKVKPVSKDGKAPAISAAIVPDDCVVEGFIAEASVEPASEGEVEGAEIPVAAQEAGAEQSAEPVAESEPEIEIVDEVEKMRKEKKPKQNRSGGPSSVTIVTIVIVALLVIALVIILIVYFATCDKEPADEVPGETERTSLDFSITDSDGNPWGDDLSTKLFFNEPRGALNIAPGDTGEYVFTIQNNEDVDVYLDIDLSESFEMPAEDIEIPIGYRISQNGSYVFGTEGFEKVYGDAAECTNLVIKAKSSSTFSIEWWWDGLDDELDTAIGEAGGTYSLEISLTLSADD